MDKILVVVGEDLRLNQNFMDEIFQICEDKFEKIENFKFIDENSMDLPFIISNLSEIYDEILIFANTATNIITKILATLKSDLLELKGEDLVPSTALKFTKNSFLININRAKINFIKIDFNEKIAEILLPSVKKEKIFYVLEKNFDEIYKISQNFNISLQESKISQNLTKFIAKKQNFGNIDEFLKEISMKFEVLNCENLINFIVEKLRLNNAKITFAESCTAGLLASKFGEISGLSDVFDGSIVSYANEIKNIWLEVNNEILQNYGAVSKECVSQMLDGAINSSGASFALAVSGIAGPNGGSAQKPVGTIFIGAAQNGGKKLIERFNLKGNRNFIRNQSVLEALVLLIKLRKDIFL